LPESMSQHKATVLRATPAIAVVDDDESIRRALYRLLRSDGLAAATFASAHEFLEAHRRQEFACVILDVYMGRMSGLDLAERFLSEGTHLPIILITAHDDEQIRERAQRVGVSAYLRKPVDAKVLLDAVRRAAGIDASLPVPLGS
jgi:FixJ family two-component response regulator